MVDNSRQKRLEPRPICQIIGKFDLNNLRTFYELSRQMSWRKITLLSIIITLLLSIIFSN